MKTILHAASALAVSLATASAHDVAKPGLAYDKKDAKVTLVYEHPLPDVPGKSVKGVLVEYGPGGYSSAHTHAKSALIYATVLEGAIQSAVNGGETKTFIAGQNFTELPGDRHDVSANASKTEPAKLLAVFVVDTDDTALTTPRKP
ncbi:cupin domain-containing protein [Agrobacterium sp. RS6]|uniref:cupin domain-containing protein n=1 Tax=Agrobacterium sp. RS6 TaxID=2489001 RepID=UPI000FDD492B|nr:cupin domain-containing protein [Agrobacterium sp. RS6]